MRVLSVLAACLAVLATPIAAAAAEGAPVRARYVAYVAGIPVLDLEAEVAFGADGTYRLATALRTRGIASLFVSGEQNSQSEGVLPRRPEERLRPARYVMDGTWNGRVRRIALDYVAGMPVVRTLDPPNAEEREAVPPDLQSGTVDALSALAGLMRSVAETGRCEGEAKMFDGRRRTDFVAATVGEAVLERDRRGIFAGRTTVCRFEGRQVAGFYRNWDREEAAKPRQGRAWMARLFADAPPLPVRLELDSGWFGTAVLYLTFVERTGLATAVSRPAP
ncbi:MAG: DUF3108 domain-containing protein [Acetobacteraceae bacterium]|nr:DUF3108 domain-containing protein [Acetobacteraceae bacterium]